MTALFSDNFVGADGTKLSSHLPDADASGCGWRREWTAFMQITGNKAVPSQNTFSEPYSRTVASAHATDYTLTVSVRFNTGADDARIYFRVGVDNTGFNLYIRPNSGLFRFYKYIGNTYIELADADGLSLSAGVDYTVTIVVKDNSATGSITGVSGASITTALDRNRDATLFGIGGKTTGVSYDSVTVESLSEIVGCERSTASGNKFLGMKTVAELTDVEGASIADITGNGMTDLVVADSTNGNLYWYERGATLTQWLQHTITDSGTHDKIEGTVAADFDGDGQVEVIALDQVGDTVTIYKQDTSDPRGAWTGTTLVSGRNRVQRAISYDVDGDGLPEVVYTAEGDVAGQGKVYLLDFTGSDVTLANDWTESVITSQEGAWWIDGPAAITSDVQNQLVLSARSNGNDDASPGVFVLTPTATVTDQWTKTTISDVNTDWLQVSVGNFLNRDSVSVLATDGPADSEGVVTFDQTNNWQKKAFPVPNKGVTGTDIWSVQSVTIPRNTRQAVFFSIQDHSYCLSEFVDGQWLSTRLAYCPDISHPSDGGAVVMRGADREFGLMVADANVGRLLMFVFNGGQTVPGELGMVDLPRVVSSGITTPAAAAIAAQVKADPPTVTIDTASIADEVYARITQLPITANVFDAQPLIIDLPNERPIVFGWPVAGATITAERKHTDNTYVAAAGAVTQLSSAAGDPEYQLAYDVADRLKVPGSRRYRFTDGTYTMYLTVHYQQPTTNLQFTPAEDAF